MADLQKFSPSEILDLPVIERRIFLRISRQGRASTNRLVNDLKIQENKVLKAITNLVDKGLISNPSSDHYEVSLGEIAPHTHLPKALWPALLPSGRLYSAQEIESLWVAIPMLQFSRAKNSEFTDHGPGHALRVKSYATQLSYLLNLTDIERSLLRLAAIFHDIGNIVGREGHNVTSQQVVEDLASRNVLPFSTKEALIVGLICRWHRLDYDPKRVDTLRNEKVRTGFLASLLRVSDAMDIDYPRADYDEQFREVVEYFFPQHIPFWSSIEEVLGVRILCSPEITLQVFTQSDVKENIQIDMLRDDLASTNLDWDIKRVSILDSYPPEKGRSYTAARAIILLSLEPHSFVMAALSKKNLEKSGFGVDIHCVFETLGGTGRKNKVRLSALDIMKYHQIVLIGDRFDDSPQEKYTTIKSWLQAGKSVSLLVRQESSLTYLPSLLAEGAEAILGNDWAYFWGDSISFRDLMWARIASLSTRETSQAVFKKNAIDERVFNGFLQTVFKISDQISRTSMGDLNAQVLTVLDQIVEDNRFFSLAGSNDFKDKLDSITPSYKRVGRVLVFDELKSFAPPWIYSYLLENAIEKQGRSFDRGIRFNVPYAVVFWREGDFLEFIAINHWRDEFSTPVRLLYANPEGSLIESNDYYIQACIPLVQGDHVIQKFINACNSVSNQSIFPTREGAD